MVMDAALLHMDPNSPEAQVFYQLGSNSSQSTGSPSTSPNGNVTYTSLVCPFISLFI
jgi:hypothetical protein